MSRLRATRFEWVERPKIDLGPLAVVSTSPPPGVRMSDQGSSVPPCWAADPTGRHTFRWWDGTAWTGHVFDGPVPPADAPGPPPSITIPQEAEPAATAMQQDQPPPFPGEPYGDHGGYGDEGGEPPGSRTRHGPERSRRAFLLGALVGGLVVAVLAGVAWVTVGDDGGSTKTVVVRVTTTTSKSSTTTTLASSTSTAPSTTLAGRPPAQVRVLVLNGSGTAGAAQTKADQLKAAGYTNVDVGNANAQKGTTVACKTGFDTEAASLAQVVGGGATTKPFPTPPPAGSENSDCVVTLGS